MAGSENTIVVVDDEVDLREMVLRILRIAGYHNVFLAANGVEALALLEQIKPDLVVSDLMMPEMSGYELIENIKNSEHFRHTPVIAISALRPEIEEENLWDAFLCKPISIQPLMHLVREFLKPQAETCAPVRVNE